MKAHKCTVDMEAVRAAMVCSTNKSERGKEDENNALMTFDDSDDDDPGDEAAGDYDGHDKDHDDLPAVFDDHWDDGMRRLQWPCVCVTILISLPWSRREEDDRITHVML